MSSTFYYLLKISTFLLLLLFFSASVQLCDHVLCLLQFYFLPEIPKVASTGEYNALIIGDEVVQRLVGVN